MNLGELVFFLGVEVHRTPKYLRLSQRKYVLDLLRRRNMLTAKPAPTSMVSSPILSLYSGTYLSYGLEYRSTVGFLQYLLLTRPDIAFLVNKVCQFLLAPTDEHWKAVKRILRYLCGTVDLGLTLSTSSDFTLHTFSDADWTGCPDDKKSTGSSLIFIGNNQICWAGRR